LLLCSCLAGASAKAETEADAAAELRQELKTLHNDYEKRIAQLEERIKDLENAKPATRQTAPPARRSPQAKPKQSAAKPAPAAAPEAPAESASADAATLTGQARAAFRGDTETRDLARSTEANGLLDKRIETILEGYVDINGYFRAGYGRSDQDGPQRAFGLPGVSKYRLGNEAENYGEINFAKTFFKPGAFTSGAAAQPLDGPVAQMNLMLSFYNPYENYGTSAATEFSVPQLWASVANVIPGKPEAKVWAGSRYYRRHDIHLNDFYFWDMSGGGGGIEDLALGSGKLALAWIGDGAESAIYSHLGNPDPSNLAGFSKTNLDLRYYDWALLGGTGEVGLTYSSARSGVDSTGTKAADADGIGLSLVWTQRGFPDDESIHKLSLQAANGPAKTFTSGFETFNSAGNSFIRPDPSDSWRIRATDHWVVKPIDQLSFGTAFVYQYTEFGDQGPSQNWLSGGVRPVWYLTDSVSIALEGGVDWISDSPDGQSGTLGKLTLAPQWSLGNGFFSRPVIRGFVTYAGWNDGMRGSVGGSDYANKTSGWSWGMQMETWW
jgi:maltoporin